MIFELWNHASGNAVADFDAIEAALAAVRAELAVHGPSYLAEWTLVVTDGAETQTIAAGKALITLAGGSRGVDLAVPA